MGGWWGVKASLTWEKTGTKAGKVGPCVASLDLLGDILELVMQEFVVSQTCVMLCVTALVIFLWFRVGHTPPSGCALQTSEDLRLQVDE